MDTQGTGKDESQVMSQINKLENAISSLSDIVNSFDPRLSNVLREAVPPPGSPKTSEEVEEALVPVASYIRDQRRSIILITSSLTDTFNRLEN